MSIQTTLAGRESAAAQGAWHRHKAFCQSCGSRRYENCTEGKRLQQDARDARAEHSRQRYLDRQPARGQGELL